MGTERESDGSAILGGFLDGVNGDEFDVGHCQALGLQEQVAEILIATTSVDQHANVPVDCFDYAKANSRSSSRCRLDASATSPPVSRTEPAAATSAALSTGSGS